MAGYAVLGPENDVRLDSKYPLIISGVLRCFGVGEGEWVFLFVMKALLTSEKEDYLNHFCMNNTYLKI